MKTASPTSLSLRYGSQTAPDVIYQAQPTNSRPGAPSSPSKTHTLY